jgi:hypothetical protein
LLHNLKPNDFAGLFLDDHSPVAHMAAGTDIVNPQSDQIACTQFAIDG